MSSDLMGTHVGFSAALELVGRASNSGLELHQPRLGGQWP